MAASHLVTSLSDVMDNIARYQSAIARGELLDVVSYVQHWYAIEDDGGWLFAPSKFIGYAGMTAKTYAERHATELHGRELERVLKAWFVELPGNHPLETDIMGRLRQYVAGLGKAVNGRANIHVLKERILSSTGRTAAAAEGVDRITASADILGGKPCIRGLRMRVSDILDMLAEGATRSEILEDFPYLEDDDITAALAFAARAVDHRLIKAA